MISLCDFMILSRCHPLQSKGGKMRGMEVQMIGQAPGRADRVAVPGAQRQRYARRGDRFEVMS